MKKKVFFVFLVVIMVNLLFVFADNSLPNSRTNPYDIGTTAIITMDKATLRGNISIKSEMCIKEIIRGESAWAKIVERNKYNRKPEDGYEYILAKIYFNLVDSSDKESQYNLSNYDFDLVSTDGKDYENISVVLPSPEINSQFYSGTSHEGWAIFQVKKDDKSPVIAYGRSFDGRGGVWFKAYNSTNSNNTTQAINNTTPISNNNITDLSTASGVQQYLLDNYSQLNTSKGNTKFNFSIYENKDIIQAFDYWIMVDYDSQFFFDLKYSNQWTNEERMKVKKELKDFIEKIGKDLTDKLPNKKLYGGYYKSWYRYPNLQVDLITRHYYSWTNYEEPSKMTSDMYNITKPSTFRWWALLDDEL